MIIWLVSITFNTLQMSHQLWKMARVITVTWRMSGVNSRSAVLALFSALWIIYVHYSKESSVSERWGSGTWADLSGTRASWNPRVRGVAAWCPPPASTAMMAGTWPPPARMAPSSSGTTTSTPLWVTFCRFDSKHTYVSTVQAAQQTQLCE